jgi:hypothetical protein
MMVLVKQCALNNCECQPSMNTIWNSKILNC